MVIWPLWWNSCVIACVKSHRGVAAKGFSSHGTGYRRTERSLQNEVPDYAATLGTGKHPSYRDPED